MYATRASVLLVTAATAGLTLIKIAHSALFWLDFGEPVVAVVVSVLWFMFGAACLVLNGATAGVVTALGRAINGRSDAAAIAPLGAGVTAGFGLIGVEMVVGVLFAIIAALASALGFAVMLLAMFAAPFLSYFSGVY